MSAHPDPHDPDVTVVASVSGGKDSTAMSLLLTEQGIEHERLFADTGWEAADTDVYVADYLPTVIGPIKTVRSAKYPGGFEELCEKRGMFPSRLRRMCTQELKVFPIRDYLREFDCEVINAVGIRRGESRARSQMDEWEWNAAFDAWTWRPLIHWSEQDVIDIHHRHDVRPNPLYLKGATRVGCWPCIFARKEELRLVGEIDEPRIVTIRELERRVQEAARERYAKKGETFESLGYQPPTMFHDRGKQMTPIPIDQMVDWANTGRGGYQRLLFDASDDRDGCMRWGLCDTGDD